MNAATIKEFWNHTFADETNADRVVRLSVYDYGTGREITIDGAIVNGRDTVHEAFLAVVKYLEANPPEIEVPVTQARETHIAHFTEIIHHKKTYYVEEHKDGTIVIQTPERTILDASSKTAQAITDKYKLSKLAPEQPTEPDQKE